MATDFAAPMPAEPSHDGFMELLRQAAVGEARLLAAPPRSPARAALTARLQAALAVGEGHKSRWQSPAELPEVEKRPPQQRKAPPRRQTVALHSATLREEARAQRLEEARKQAEAAAYLRRQQAANKAYGELARQRARQSPAPAATARPPWQGGIQPKNTETREWQPPQQWSLSSEEYADWQDDDLSTAESCEDDVPVMDAATEMKEDLLLTPAEEPAAPAVEVHDAAVQHTRSVADVSTWTDTLPAEVQAGGEAAPVGDHGLEEWTVAGHILRRMRLQRHLHARPAVNPVEPAAAETQHEDEPLVSAEQQAQSPPPAGTMDARALVRRLVELSAPVLRDGATALPCSALDALGASRASALPLFEAVNEAMALRMLGCSQLSKDVWLHQLANVGTHADRMEAVVKYLGDRVESWMACAIIATEEERLEMQHAADLEADQRIWDDAVERHYQSILQAPPEGTLHAADVDDTVA